MSQPAWREARIDLDALRANLAQLEDVVPDVSHGAWGHGMAVVDALREFGCRTLSVRDESARAALASRVGSTVEVVVSSDAAVAAPLYGVGARPVMRLCTRVVAIKTIDAGEPVSYGYTWRAARRTNLALIGLGYADGITRRASNLGSTWVAGALRPIVGRIAMDVHVVDLGDDIVVPGDEAVLFGDPSVGAATLEQWAHPLGLHPLDCTTGIGARVVRTIA